MTQAVSGSEVDAAGNVKVTTAGQTAAGAVQLTGTGLSGAIISGYGGSPDNFGGGNFLYTVAVVVGQTTQDNTGNFRNLRTASAINLIAQSGLGALLVTPPGEWSVVSTPAAGTQATASKAAGAAGVRHVYASAIFSYGAIAAPVATLLQANVRDGATGVGTVLDAAQAAVQAAVFATVPIPLSGKNVPGTAATAMTAEFSALLANLAEGAAIQGYDAS